MWTVPVLALMKVDSMDEAVALANNVEFGLSACASIYTKDIGNMCTFIKDMEAGLVGPVWWNESIELSFL